MDLERLNSVDPFCLMTEVLIVDLLLILFSHKRTTAMIIIGVSGGQQ
jgi:hypothetical protein